MRWALDFPHELKIHWNYITIIPDYQHIRGAYCETYLSLYVLAHAPPVQL